MRFRCRKSHSYSTLVAATEALDELAAKRKRQGNDHQETRAYFCNICLMWHLTSAAPRRG